MGKAANLSFIGLLTLSPEDVGLSNDCSKEELEAAAEAVENFLSEQINTLTEVRINDLEIFMEGFTNER